MSRTNQLLKSRWLQHILFWSLSLYALLKNFQVSSELAVTDYIYTGVFSMFLVAAVYVNLLALIPGFFQQGRYGIYMICVSAVLVGFSWAQILLFDYIIEWIFPGYYLISYFDFWETSKYFVILVGVSSLLHFSKSWFLYRESQARLSELQKEKLEAELNALKNQINPHFLFNSLNSIYSMVLRQSSHAPEALIRLSDSMRYIIYESNHDYVGLSKEIEFIRNYIALQQLRMSEKDTLKFEISGDMADQQIAPLLLIPLIENGFKHGIKGETEEAFIEISITINERTLSMTVVNNLGSVDPVEKNESGGAGLVNLKKRLGLIYPGRHALIIDKAERTFTVKLTIEL
ncbi:MAG: histidine kinase [Cyclobacteriaceae bacterium]|nr:histidine kinase [Cyclobacteriaceae bacterium]